MKKVIIKIEKNIKKHIIYDIQEKDMEDKENTYSNYINGRKILREI